MTGHSVRLEILCRLECKVFPKHKIGILFGAAKSFGAVGSSVISMLFCGQHAENASVGNFKR